MAFDYKRDTQTITRSQVDEGLRSYMLSVYNYMAMGLGLTGLMAFVVATSPVLQQVFLTPPLVFVVMFAPLALVFFLSFRVHTLKFSTAQALFWVYSALMGLSLASVFLLYSGTSVARVFFITAGTFGAMSLYGYTTHRDLTTFGGFLLMGLIGIILASIVNIFLKSTGLQFVVSVIGVVVFVGLTAFDTQRIKLSYIEGEEAETAGKKAVMGALQLYLDFINLFLMLLRLLGDRR